MRRLVVGIMLFLFLNTVAAQAATFQQPVKRMTADEIVGTLVNSPYGRNIKQIIATSKKPEARGSNYFTWNNTANETKYSLFYDNIGTIYQASLYEVGYSVEDARGRSDILAGQFARRFGPPDSDETADNSTVRTRLWNFDGKLAFTLTTSANDAGIMYAMRPLVQQ